VQRDRKRPGHVDDRPEIGGVAAWKRVDAQTTLLPRETVPEADVHRLTDAGHYVVEDAHERIVPLAQEFLRANPVAERAG